MAILAEKIVEEWLNRQGYFTIRGIRLGVDEIDLLALKPNTNGLFECRHIEVQASMRPVSFITKVPKNLQKLGRAANSAKRSSDELVVGVAEWVSNKFRKRKKTQLMQKLFPGPWSSELVINRVRSQDEVELIRKHDIKIILLENVVRDLQSDSFVIKAAGESDFVDLILVGVVKPLVPSEI